jgi:A/G-specific adenine glycosylase
LAASYMKHQRFFSSSVLLWAKNCIEREMPWKRIKDPYKIWISEIILQQTRVEQGRAYYEKFITAFPDVCALATAPEDEIFKIWEGLGYYSRCKNLIASAKFIHKNSGGKFPVTYEELLALKGVGAYTAAAIASFAYDLPYAVLDGNVFRVLSRFFGITTPTDTTEGKKYYRQLAQILLDKKSPAAYNQAIMDFGALVCKPSQPLCNQCPLQHKCVAFLTGKINELPVSTKTIRQRDRFFNYFIVEWNEKFYIRKRMGKDIWQNLYEFILIEKGESDDTSVLQSKDFLSFFGKNEFSIISESEIFRQKLTHQRISGKFFHLKIKKPLLLNNSYTAINQNKLRKLPFPKFILSYLTDKNVSLKSDRY